MDDGVEFDAERLRREVASLTHWKRAVFAVSCAEVLTPSYSRFADLEAVSGAELLSRSTEAVWSMLAAAPATADASRVPAPAAVRALLPGEEAWNEWAPQAEDAVAAVVYLLDLIHDGDPINAVYAAERAYAAADELAARRLDLGVLDAGQCDELRRDVSVQRELSRQQEALEVLRGCADGDQAMVSLLRDTARRLAVGA